MTAKKIKKKKPKVDNSYIINDKYFGELKIKHTANAWWKDRIKVERLITAFKMDCKIKEARVLAGITKIQFEYFKKEHPEFYDVLDDLVKVNSFKARANITKALETGDINTSKWWLERKEPDEFKEKKDVDVTERPLLIDDL